MVHDESTSAHDWQVSNVKDAGSALGLHQSGYCVGILSLDPIHTMPCSLLVQALTGRAGAPSLQRTSTPSSSSTNSVLRNHDHDNDHKIPAYLYKRSYKDHLAMASTHSQEPPQSPTTSVRNHNTGFPEPFNEARNTTMRHPDADTSKNACLEAQDIPTSRRHSRHRSFFGRRHSHEKDPYENIGFTDAARENGSGPGTASSETSEEKKVEADEEEVAAGESPLEQEQEQELERRDGERPSGKLKKSFWHMK